VRLPTLLMSPVAQVVREITRPGRERDLHSGRADISVGNFMMVQSDRWQARPDAVRNASAGHSGPK
jgi:hypothetical protein